MNGIVFAMFFFHSLSFFCAFEKATEHLFREIYYNCNNRIVCVKIGKHALIFAYV